MPPSRDILALFSAQFHVTKGNIVDWSLKADDDLSLDGVEFSALPSGIHAVDKDVVYFTLPSQGKNLQGVSVFRRLATDEQGQRGARLASLGAIVAPGSKPWRHVDHLKSAFDTALKANSEETKWTAPTALFDKYRVLTKEESLEDADEEEQARLSPLNHLPHLLPIFGPLAATLHKHVLARRRILIYCKPPIEGACVLAWVCGSLGSPLSVLPAVTEFETNESALIDVEDETIAVPRRPSATEDVQVLGCVTLNDMDRLKDTNDNGVGWVACTTDAIYLEKPSYYDLLIDLTTLKSPPPPPPPGEQPPPSNSRRLRPTFHSSVNGKLSPLRWGWSDIKPWTELDRIISLSPFPPHSHTQDDNSFCCRDPSHGHQQQPSTTSDKSERSKLLSAWSDLWIWRVYEDVCLVCAGLFLGSSSSSRSSSSGEVRLEGEENPLPPGSFYIRNVGAGIEGGKDKSPKEVKKARRGSDMSALLVSASEFAGAGRPSTTTATTSASPTTPSGFTGEGQEQEKREALRRTTTALLQTFHAQAQFMESALREVIAKSTKGSPKRPESGSEVVSLIPKDLLSLELNPWSSFDAKFVEWLGESLDRDRGGSTGGEERRKVKVSVKRNWSGLVGVLVPGY